MSVRGVFYISWNEAVSVYRISWLFLGSQHDDAVAAMIGKFAATLGTVSESRH